MILIAEVKAKPFFMLMKRIHIVLLFLVSLSCKAQQVIPLYTGTAPFSLPVEDKETSAKSTSGNRRLFVTNVTNPTITVYLPKKVNAAGTAVIICPGGGYNRLSIEDGGYEAAEALAKEGIVGIVLKYRTNRDSAYTDYKPVPLLDLKQAMDIVYSNAQKWNVDTTHIGILGFSAGGHLTAMAATSFTIRKPAFTILAYPVISFLDSLTSTTSGSRGNLLGKKISAEEKIKYSPELHITNSTPPSFIMHAKDDKTSLVGNSIAYYNGLLSKNIAAKLLLYEKGGHGFALYNKEEDKYWMPEALLWLAQNNFYKK
jgi:acetyl esterase/lipase